MRSFGRVAVGGGLTSLRGDIAARGTLAGDAVCLGVDAGGLAGLRRGALQVAFGSGRRA